MGDDPHGVQGPWVRGLSDTAVDPPLRNVFRVPLTRGMTGTILYSTDEATQAMLRSLVSVTVQEPAAVR